MEDRFRANAPAKINLGLRVLRRRLDGFHDIETVMVRIGWCDTIEVSPRPGRLTLEIHPAVLPPDQTNLCLRAATALRDSAKVTTGAHIRLEKRIPFGSGLGGGSSDAATTLQLLARMWEFDDRAELSLVASRLGSDVPFFLGDPVALATGRGEMIEPVAGEAAARLRRLSIVVAVPAVHVSTAEAYANVVPCDDATREALVDIVGSGTPARWREALTNDFEESVFESFPEVRELKDKMYAAGAAYASMSGSGSAVYGIFDTRGESDRAAERLVAESGVEVWSGRLVDRLFIS